VAIFVASRRVNGASGEQGFEPEEARRWDIEQHVSMTPQERLRAARELKDRVYPSDAKDVRECPRNE